MIALIVALLVVAVSLFWIGLLQIDTLFWDMIERGIGWENACTWLWISELKITVKNSFILMFLVATTGFCVVASIVIYFIYLMVG